jgi:hypothetical protein
MAFTSYTDTYENGNKIRKSCKKSMRSFQKISSLGAPDYPAERYVKNSVLAVSAAKRAAITTDGVGDGATRFGREVPAGVSREMSTQREGRVAAELRAEHELGRPGWMGVPRERSARGSGLVRVIPCRRKTQPRCGPYACQCNKKKPPHVKISREKTTIKTKLLIFAACLD